MLRIGFSRQMNDRFIITAYILGKPGSLVKDSYAFLTPLDYHYNEIGQ